jgi:hypothetical protein
MMKKFLTIFAFLTFISFCVTAQPQLAWRFANVEVINAGAQFQFDVEVKADAGVTYHRDLQVYFDYNTAGFGSDIVANGYVTVTPLTLMNTHYVIVNTADNTSSKFAVITEASNELIYPDPTHPVADYFNEMPTTFTGLLRITIDIASNVEMAGISFDATLMNGGQYYQSTSNTDPIKYAELGLYDNDLSTFKLSTLYGQITYANASNTPLSNCTVELYDGLVLLDTKDNDSNGDFSFAGMDDGTYSIEASCAHPRVGFNIADAFIVRQSLTPAIPDLTGIYALAADVNEDTFVNVADAFFLRQALTPAGFPPQWTAPVYVFLPVTGDVISGIGNADFEGLCSGDVNGDGTPPAK